MDDNEYNDNHYSPDIRDINKLQGADSLNDSGLNPGIDLSNKVRHSSTTKKRKYVPDHNAQNQEAPFIIDNEMRKSECHFYNSYNTGGQVSCGGIFSGVDNTDYTMEQS